MSMLLAFVVLPISFVLTYMFFSWLLSRNKKKNRFPLAPGR